MSYDYGGYGVGRKVDLLFPENEKNKKKMRRSGGGVVGVEQGGGGLPSPTNGLDVGPWHPPPTAPSILDEGP